jgi:type II restriction/modification system DNA methylase subunit YeeA
MQTALTYRTNRDLFSNYYLDEHLPETEAWDELDDDELREAKADIMDLWEREQGTAPKRNESQLEEKFIRPMFRKLGIPFEVEESTSRTQRRPDYGFFESEDAARGAFERREEGGDFYRDAVAVADAKRWGRPLDTRGSGEHQRDFENPSYQIHVYLQETPARWAVLTDGKKWRLYYGPTSHRLDSYYEIDLPTVLEKGDLEDFKYFYLFFRHGAFLEDSSGDCFLDDVYDESNVFAQELGEDLQDNIYEAIKILSEGFMQYPDNDLSEDDLGRIHDSSLIYLYRLIFVLYAESEGRDLLDTNNEIYEESYSLNTLKQDVADELDSPNPKYRDWQDNLWDRLDELFKLIDQGSQSRGIPEEDLYIPAYNGGLFRTSPGEDDSVEAQFLANHQVGDAYLAEVIELLTRSQNGNGGGKIFVDYSSLDVRHLGSIYEGLLEYQLDIADEPLVVEDEEYVPASGGDEVIVEEGEVHLTTGSGERKATGSYYTPEYVVEYIVEETLGPLVDDIRGSLVGQSAFDDDGFAEEFAEEVFDLKILDPAMGSGHFLTSAIDYLAREIIDAQERQAAQQGIETVDEDHDINWARRQVAQRCIYGVDLNPLAVELAKVSLWLRTLAAEQPLAFLDHHLKTGNSLVGSDIEEIDELESGSGGDDQNASLADFGIARKGTIEQLMRIYQDFIAIENQDLDDIKQMEAKYDEFERNKLRQRLESMANVRTAEDFGLDNIPDDAYEQMAAKLEDDEGWQLLAETDWFQDAQIWSNDHKYFHWRLEYPEVFYGKNGGELQDPGFDAVIGNPPWMDFQRIGDDEREYQREKFDSAIEKYDLYVAFVEQAAGLLKQEGGFFGYIIQNKFLSSSYGEGLKEFLVDNVGVRAILDFEDANVFSGTTTYPLILLLSSQMPEKFEYAHLEDATGEDVEEFLRDPTTNRIDTQKLTSNRPWIFPTRGEAEVVDTLRNNHHPTLEDISEDISTGIKTNLKEAYVFEEDTDSIPVEQALLRPVLDGADIRRYSGPRDDKYIIYPYEKSGSELNPINLSEYPKTQQHFLEFEEELSERLFYEKTIEEMGKEWFEFPYTSENLLGPKILFPDISTEPRCTFDSTGETLILNTAYGAVLKSEVQEDVQYVCALFNSSPLRFMFTVLSPKLSGGYYRFQTQYVGQLPIPSMLERSDDRESVESGLLTEYNEEIDSVAEFEPVRFVNSRDELGGENRVTHDFLSSLADKMVDFRSQRDALNLNLLDYLGISSDELPESEAGDTLKDLQMPVAGVADTPLAETTDEYEGLRIEDVIFKDDGNRLVLSVDISYKVDEDDSRETDRWNRLDEPEFETYEAMAFVGLSEAEETLLREFAPVAVEKAEGFAGFRQDATKTNSPLDRLKDLTLPVIDEVQTGLQQYIEVRERADQLEEKIEKTDLLIDEIVYDLYGLTEGEIEIIESAVKDD